MQVETVAVTWLRKNKVDQEFENEDEYEHD
jgi:hypothetical protein